jgi:hypothetical protein
MKATEFLKQYRAAGGMNDELLAHIGNAVNRLMIYKLLNRSLELQHHALLRQMFEKEMQFRKCYDDTANGADLHQCIYHCGYLLYRLAVPSDAYLLFAAKSIDMDVGTSFGAEYFVGAGVANTLRFLEQENNEDAKDIHSYVSEYFGNPINDGYMKSFEQGAADGIEYTHSIATERYELVAPTWPQTGNHILASFDQSTVVVYQAYRPAIAEFAVTHQRFGGEFSYQRMSWIKPNFLWMMYRAGWATKEGQERILAVRIQRDFFDSVLQAAVESSFNRSRYAAQEEWQQRVATSDVRLQWDPDHDLDGNALERRAVQLGLRGEMLRRYGDEAIVSIEDITSYVENQREKLPGDRSYLYVPNESIYVPTPAAAANVGVDLT